MYINGAVSSSGSTPGTFNNWDSGYALMLGNESSLDRPWLGELHLVAIYDRALSSGEVSLNYNAGQTQATPTPTNTPVASNTPTPTSTVPASPTPTNTPVPLPPRITTVRLTVSIAGQPIAQRTVEKDDNEVVLSTSLHYFVVDHLGSTRAMVYHSGGAVVPGTVADYKPFGGYRTAPTAVSTDRGYTGHLHTDGIGLI